jgi:glycosyltransferase involved in cell wall biosynthesis
VPELLSICIPTFDRATYLNELLDLLVPELLETDNTRNVVGRFDERWPIVYNCNSVNIGPDRNFAQMINRVEGAYFWLIGDDELVARGFLAHLLDLLRPKTHHLMLLEPVMQDGQPASFSKLQEPTVFSDYAAFVDHFQKANPWALMAHSLITSMVIKRSIFNLKITHQVLDTIDRSYAHMYGLVEGLTQDPGSIYINVRPSIIIRTHRAKVREVSSLEINYLWRRYYRWLGLKFGHRGLIAYGKTHFGWRKWWRMKRQGLKRTLGLTKKKKAQD